MEKYIRLSHLLGQNTPSYGNRDKVIIRNNSSIKNGETANSSCWIFSNNHIGTHIDVPYHFSEKGKKTFEIPIENFFFGKVQIVDIKCQNSCLIGIEEFEKLIQFIDRDIELLLIRTGFEKFRGSEKYWNDNPGLDPELANYFRLNFPRLSCVGFDFISLTSWKYRDVGRLCHEAFLCSKINEKEILVIEDMSLSKIKGEISRVIVAPIYMEDGNGGAVTVFAEMK